MNCADAQADHQIPPGNNCLKNIHTKDLLYIFPLKNMRAEELNKGFFRFLCPFFFKIRTKS